MARNAECPNRLPGSSNRKLKVVRAKDPKSLNAEELKLLAYGEYVITKRSKYYEKKRLDEEGDEKKTDGTQSMEGVEIATAPQQ
jgi:hypothetical protein